RVQAPPREGDREGTRIHHREFPRGEVPAQDSDRGRDEGRGEGRPGPPLGSGRRGRRANRGEHRTGDPDPRLRSADLPGRDLHHEEGRKGGVSMADEEPKAAKKVKKTAVPEKPAEKEEPEEEKPLRKKPKKPKEKEEAEERVHEARAKPKLDDRLKQLLALRSAKNAARPKFRRQEWFRYRMFGDEWRKPQGGQSKLRRHFGYRWNLPSIAYREPRAVRGLHPSGFQEILVQNERQLEGLDVTKQAVRNAHGVRTRKQ